MATRDADTDGRPTGRDATAPRKIPAAGWKAVGKRVLEQLKRDHVSLLAAGVAFKGLLALFPAIVAGVTVWGLVASPAQITQQLSDLLSALPQDASSIIEEQMTGVAGQAGGTLSAALAVSLLIALWAASSGMAGLVEGCNAAYDEVDRRGFLRKRGLALLLTLGGILFLLISIGLIAVLPAVLGELGLGRAGELAVRIGQWPLLAVLVVTALAVIYRYAPDRARPRIRWVTWGAVIATLLWLLGSALFTVYVENFGSYNQTYGAFAGIIILMLWLYLSALVVLLGAEINAETERQTGMDTTEGKPRLRGTRGAVVADATPDERMSDERGRAHHSP